MKKQNAKDYEYSDEILVLPVLSEPAAFYGYLGRTSAAYLLQQLIHTIGLNDDLIAGWLNITTRTFRNYKTKNTEVKPNTKEHIAAILALYDHGLEVFSDKKQFEAWLTLENPLLDYHSPSDFLNTISGIQFIDSRLTAMEFGENV